MASLKRKREPAMDFLTGPALQVTVTASDMEKTWILPIALLHKHSGYFKRLQNFKEGIEGKGTLKDFEPDIFELFVELIYFDQYTHSNDLPVQVWNATKACVLGDYLDASKFKRFSERQLHNNIYIPADGSIPKAGITPSLIDYCCSNTRPNCSIQRIYLALLIRYWQTPAIVLYNKDTAKDWAEVWNKHPEFLNALLLGLSNPGDLRGDYVEAMRRALGEPVTT